MIIYNILYKPLLNLLSFGVDLLFPLFSKNKERIAKGYPNLDNSIWIHASSVGETNALKPFIIQIIKDYPNDNIVITTMTTTGKQSAQAISQSLEVKLIPFDIPRYISKILTQLSPKVLIIAETEIWPAMITESNKRNIPIMISNGRISNRSFPRYKKLSFFLKFLTSSITEILAQSELDSKRFKELGFKNTNNSGNLKFAVDLPTFNKNDSRSLFGFTEDDYIITFGSSRPGEEKLIIAIFSKLLKKHKNLKLILVPRHIKRVAEIQQLFTSQIFDKRELNLVEQSILLVDKMGVLPQLYSICDIAIVGGSFVDFSGHNPLEPAFYSKPTIIGEYHSSCLDSVKKLKDNDAIVVSSQEKLLADIDLLIEKPILAEQLGRNAKKTMHSNKNALCRNANTLKKLLELKYEDSTLLRKKASKKG